MKWVTVACIYFMLSSGLFADETFENRLRQLPILQAIPEKNFQEGIAAGLWNNEKTAHAVTFKDTTKTICLVIITINNKFIVSDVSMRETGNFGKLGIASRNQYEKYQTFPSKWHKSTGTHFIIEFTTQAWINGQKYTVEGPVAVSYTGAPVFQ